MFVNVSIILIYIVLFLKWILFLLLTLIVKIRNKSRIEYKGDISNPKTSSDNKKSMLYVKMIKSLRLRELYSGFVRYMDFQVGMIPSHHIRKFIYKWMFGVDIQRKVVIYFGSEIRAHANLHIGEGSIIGDRAILDARSGIYIGKNVNLSSNVRVWTYQHDHSDPNFNCTKDKVGPVYIGDRVWIGPDVTILHSVSIGEGAVVAAGAVVTNDVPPFTIVAGVPAKVIGHRNKNLVYEFSGNYLRVY